MKSYIRYLILSALIQIMPATYGTAQTRETETLANKNQLLKMDDFSVYDGNLQIRLGMLWDDVKMKMPSAKNCADNTCVDKEPYWPGNRITDSYYNGYKSTFFAYYYDGIELITANLNIGNDNLNRDYIIYSIRITSPKYITSKNISVGMESSKIITQYGEASDAGEFDGGKYITYTKGARDIGFYINKFNKVSEIWISYNNSECKPKNQKDSYICSD